MGEVGFHRCGEILEYASRLLAAGFDDREDGGDETAALRALRSEGQLPPDHSMPQCTFAGVVRWLDAFHFQEGPEPFAMMVEFPAHAVDRPIPAEHSAQQETFRLLADWLHQPLHLRPCDRTVAAARPKAKKFARTAREVMPQSFDLPVAVVDQRLKVAFQVRPT